MPERLQKWLAGAGLGSRRQIDTWIAAGRIKVNGKLAVPGCTVSGRERITLDGELLRGLATRRRAQPRVLIYHKPVGEVATRSDPEGRPTVFERLPTVTAGRWIGVGRLDVDTAGLLVFTTDGALAHRLMHPSYGLTRLYAVRLRGNPSAQEIERLLAGVALEDGPGRFDSVTAAGGEGSNRWYHVTVAEGRNRIVRRLWESIDCQVSRLIRIQYGPLVLPRHLPRGETRELRGRELAAVYRAVGLDPPGDDPRDGAAPASEPRKRKTARIKPGSRSSRR
ncbi:MAG: pseudouridine synthase [Gammaproteobacteria bacterium]|nr:pseudouridine synthase [Gammaproteobacteria bacterium]